MHRPLVLAGLTAGLGVVGLSAFDALRAAPPQFGTNVVIVDASDPALPRQVGVDTSGNLKINCIAGCSAGSGTGANDADNVAAVSTGLGSAAAYGFLYDGATWDRARGDSTNGAFVNIKAFNGNTVSTGTGASGSGTQRVVLSSDSALAANQSVNLAQVGGSNTAIGHGTASGALRVELPTDGTGVVGLAAGTNAIGAVTHAAATSGGATPYHLSGGTTASTNSTSIKGSAGTLYGLVSISTSATLAYLKIYDTSSAPTCSSATNLKHVYPIPASISGAGFVIPIPVAGEAYANGIGFCVTGGGSDTDNTSAPTGIYVEGTFK